MDYATAMAPVQFLDNVNPSSIFNGMTALFLLLWSYLPSADPWPRLPDEEELIT